MAELIITYNDSRPPVRQTLQPRAMVIGRDPSCDIALDPGDVSTSRRHARIAFNNGIYTVEDMGSKNGTLVNNVVQPFKRLENGDVITLGTVTLRFIDGSAATAASVVLADTAPRIESSSFTSRDHELLLSQQRLKMLYEISNRLLTLKHRDELLQEVMDICFETLHFERGAIAIRKQNSRGVDWPVVRNLYGAGGELTVSRTILGRALDRGERAIVNETDSESVDPTVSMVQHGIRSAMCVPLTTGSDEILGVIYGDRISRGTDYRTEDVDFLAALARQVSIGLINARLLEEQKIKLLLEGEIELAREIQCELFPKVLPKRDNVRIAALNEPGRHVSGDYYDVMELSGGRIALLIADVTGEGVAASLLMANLQAAVRVTLPNEDDLPGLLARWNKLLHTNTEADKFATCLVGIVDPATRKVALASAGHQSPFMLRADDGAISELEVDAGLPLGVIDRAVFEVQTHDLGAAPCTLFYYTDGVSEAMNEAGQLFGTQRLREVIAGATQPDPDALLKQVQSAVRDFRGSAPQSDDITMLALSLT